MLSLHHLMLDEVRALTGRGKAENIEQGIYHGEQARRVFQDSPEAKELQATELMLGMLFYLRSEGNRNESSERAAQFLEPLSKDPAVDPALVVYLDSFLIKEQFIRTGITFNEKLKRVNEHISHLSQIEAAPASLDKQKLIAERKLT
jgi:hypothetical protein